MQSNLTLCGFFQNQQEKRIAPQVDCSEATTTGLEQYCTLSYMDYLDQSICSASALYDFSGDFIDSMSYAWGNIWVQSNLSTALVTSNGPNWKAGFIVVIILLGVTLIGFAVTVVVLMKKISALSKPNPKNQVKDSENFSLNNVKE